MAEKPDKLPRWATVEEINPITGVNSVLEPSEEKKDKGWQYKEYPPRQWMNWVAQLTYKWLSYFKERDEKHVQTDGTGIELFPLPNHMIILYAIDTSNPANYLHAVGYRGDTTPVLNVLASSGLTLGTPNIAGDYPILGADSSNIIAYSISQKLN